MEESVEAGTRAHNLSSRGGKREKTRHREELTVGTVVVGDLAPPPPPPPPPPPTAVSLPVAAPLHARRGEVHEVRAPAGEDERTTVVVVEDDRLWVRDDDDLAPETSGDSGYSAEVELSDLLGGGQTQSQSQPQI